MSVPTAFASEVMDCLEDMAASWAEVPQPLEEAFRHSLELVAAPDGDASEHHAGARAWECCSVFGGAPGCIRAQLGWWRHSTVMPQSAMQVCVLGSVAPFSVWHLGALGLAQAGGGARPQRRAGAASGCVRVLESVAVLCCLACGCVNARFKLVAAPGGNVPECSLARPCHTPPRSS